LQDGWDIVGMAIRRGNYPMGLRSRLALLVALPVLVESIVSAFAQPDDGVSSDDELAAYCLGANGELAERFRRMRLWGCGKAPGMAWCREAKARAPDAMRERELLVMRFAKYLSDKGLFDADRPAAFRQKLNEIVASGSSDAGLGFNPDGEKDEAACGRLQRSTEAEKRIKGL
jgi:hypothetical protein